MFIKLLKAIAELVYVSVRLGYDYMFYPSSKTVERAKNIIDPEYNPTEYGSSEKAEALKDEWIQGNISPKSSGETVAAQKNTKKILKES